jgi:hypothetical protein
VRRFLHRFGVHWWRTTVASDTSDGISTTVAAATCRICGMIEIRSVQSMSREVGECCPACTRRGCGHHGPNVAAGIPCPRPFVPIP